MSLVLLIFHKLEALHIERDKGKRCSPLPILEELSHLEREAVLSTENRRTTVKNYLPNDDIKAEIALFERVHSIAEDGIDLFGLIGFALFEGEVSRSCDFISQEIVVEL